MSYDLIDIIQFFKKTPKKVLLLKSTGFLLAVMIVCIHSLILYGKSERITGKIIHKIGYNLPQGDNSFLKKIFFQSEKSKLFIAFNYQNKDYTIFYEKTPPYIAVTGENIPLIISRNNPEKVHIFSFFHFWFTISNLVFIFFATCFWYLLINIIRTTPR